MHRVGIALLAGLLAPSALALWAFTATAHAGEPVFTEAWEGIWDVDYIERECDGPVTAEFTGFARFCGGETTRFNQGYAFPYTCDGLITDDSVDMTCHWEVTPFPDCTAMYDYELGGVRVGDVMAGNEIFLLTFVGNCTGLEPICTDTEFTGARGSTDPECDSSPTRSASWTGIKSVYR